MVTFPACIRLSSLVARYWSGQPGPSRPRVGAFPRYELLYSVYDGEEDSRHGPLRAGSPESGVRELLCLTAASFGAIWRRLRGARRRICDVLCRPAEPRMLVFFASVRYKGTRLFRWICWSSPLASALVYGVSLQRLSASTNCFGRPWSDGPWACGWVGG